MPRTLAVVIVFLLTFLMLALIVVLIGPLIDKQVSALLAALPEIVARAEQVWMPNVFELLNIDAGEDVGLGAFFERYADTVSSWSGKVLLSVTKSGGALACCCAEPVPDTDYHVLPAA